MHIVLIEMTHKNESFFTYIKITLRCSLSKDDQGEIWF